jgi:DNA primase
MNTASADESRYGVTLTNLDQPLFDGAGATKQLIDPEIATTAFVKADRNGKVFVDATRVGGATVVAAYSPRVRPGVPVSFPIAWEDLDEIAPPDFTIHTALRLLDGCDPWREHMPMPQRLSPNLLAEGRGIPVARVQAMHEGKRRARAARDKDGG